MAIDFPNSPSVGDLYPVSPGPGVPQYRWTGVVWTTTSSQAGLPAGKQVIYNDGTVAMVHALTLSGDPTNPTDAADKNYVDNQIGGISFVPSGTIMLFYMAAAPVGWTKVTSQNDKLLRVVSGTSGGSAGGTNSFSSVMAQTNVGGHTLSAAEIPGINSIGTNAATLYLGGSPSWYTACSNPPWAWNPQYYYGGGGTALDMAYQYTGSGSRTDLNNVQGNLTTSVASNNTGGGSHVHPITLDIQYCDIILASKN